MSQNWDWMTLFYNLIFKIMKKLLMFSMAIVMALSACKQINEAPKPKVGEKMYYEITDFSADTIRKIEYVLEVLEVTDTTVTSSQTYIFPGEEEKLTYEYTSDGTENDSEVSIKSIFHHNLMPYMDSLEFVEGDTMAKYQNKMDETTVLEPARALFKSKAEGKDVMIELSIEERKVLGKEMVTTPAGTFECIKFSEKHVAKIDGEESVKLLFAWYNNKTDASVRQTDCDKEGNVIYEVLLVKMEQPQ